jgi:hypothetical protein
MKKTTLILFLTLIALVAGACSKEAPRNANTTAAKPANANSAPATTAAPAAGKTEVKPVSTAGGDNVFSHPNAGIQFEVPNSWKAEVDGEMMTVSAADGSLSIVFWVPKEVTVDAALDALDTELGKIMKNVKPNGEPEKGNLNGMMTYSAEGTGEIEGTSIEWSCHLMEAKKPVIALTFAAPGAYDQHQKDVDAFVKSIKKSS